MQAMIVDVTLNNVQETIMQNSKRLPVLIHFWSIHNKESLQANTILEKLAQDMAGQFVLAKVNVDQQPELNAKFSNPKPPFYKLAKDLDILTEGEGLLTEEAYMALLSDHLVEDPSEQLRQQAAQAFQEGQVEQAVQYLHEAAKENPKNTNVPLDLVQLYLYIGETEQAKEQFDRLPEEAKKSVQGRYIKGSLYFSEYTQNAPDITEVQANLSKNENDCDALFYLSIYLIQHDQIEPAIQTLLKLFTVNRTYQSGLPQKSIVQLFDMYANVQPDLITNYRRRFQSLLN